MSSGVLDRSTTPAARTHRRARAATATALKYLSLVIAAIVVLVPLGVIVLTSLKTSAEVNNDPVLSVPHNWFNFHNYVVAFNRGHMLQAFGNTAFILLISVTGSVFLGSMTAYAIDRFQFRLKKLIVALFLLATLVPSITTQVATFQIVNYLGLFDTRWSAVVLYMGTDIIAVYIFLQFIRGIPISLDESARMDGANSFTIYWRIILPLLKPAIATVVIVKGIAVYNDFYIPFLYMPDDNLGTISTSLFRFKGPFGAHWEDLSAGVVLVILPTFVIFLLLQRFIYNGFTMGATK
jgi:multiple sugar transport system permease protein